MWILTIALVPIKTSFPCSNSIFTGTFWITFVNVVPDDEGNIENVEFEAWPIDATLPLYFLPSNWSKLISTIWPFFSFPTLVYSIFAVT